MLLAGVLAIVATAYSTVGTGDFVWDDRPLIVEEPAVHNLDPLAYFTRPFWTPSPLNRGHNVYFRPLTTLSYAVDWTLSGGAAGWFHVVNVALHVATCALLFGLARAVGATPIAAALGAVVFGVTPRLSECVAWVSGRTDVLASLLALTALWLHLARPDRAVNRVAAALLVFAALLAKEVAIAAAAGVIAAESVRVRRGALVSTIIRVVPMAAAIAAYSVLRVSVLRAAPALAPAVPMSSTARLLTPLDALGQYGWMVVDALRPRLQIGILGQVRPGMVALGAILAAALGVALWRTLRRRDHTAVAFSVTAAVALGLVLHVVQIQLEVIAADRFLYLPAAAVTVLAARAASRAHRRLRQVTAVAACLAVPVLATATYERSAEWADELTLWRRAVETTPVENPLPIHEYGTALFRAGRMQDAVAQYQRSADLATGQRRTDALMDVATTLSDMGLLDEGAAKMRDAMASASPKPLYHYNMGVLEARRLQFESAEAELVKALTMLPRYPQALSMLAAVRHARAEWAKLPLERPGEALHLKVTRAALYGVLTANVRAAELWREIVKSDAATGQHCVSAAAFFIHVGARDGAADAIACAKLRAVDPRITADLQAAMARRMGR